MTKAAVELRKAYFKKWREANKDKVKQYQANYWERIAKTHDENNNGNS